MVQAPGVNPIKNSGVKLSSVYIGNFCWLPNGSSAVVARIVPDPEVKGSIPATRVTTNSAISIADIFTRQKRGKLRLCKCTL